MLKLGSSPSSEEFGPEELVRFAEQAESTGFEFALISDHFHPWTDRQVTVCWAPTEEQGIETALGFWPVGSLGGAFKAELPRPAHFQDVTRTARPEDIAKEIACLPDPRKHLEAIAEYAKAGFNHVHVHQVGPDQEGFFRFYGSEVLPNLRRMAA